MSIPLRVMFVSLAAVLVLAGLYALAYPFAGGQYRKLLDQKAKSRDAVEETLWGYCARQIEPRDSQWGSSHSLAPGDYMVSYRMLCIPSNAIDVVYSDQDVVLDIYTSYE